MSPKEEDALNLTRPERTAHLAVNQVLILPSGEAARFNAKVYSLAVNFGDQPAGKTEFEIRRLAGRVAFDIFAGVGRQAYYYSSTRLSSFSGAGNIFIPLVMAGLIVLGTMLGSVHERLKEISTYSAVGLAPIHVAMLFVAEASVYATLGAIIGYLGGQFLATTLSALGWLSGLTLDYSSASTVITTMIIMLVVVASSLYPARQAARLAAPASERKWKLPEPKDNRMTLELPFTFRREDVPAAAGFILAWFEYHGEGSDGKFICREARLLTGQYLADGQGLSDGQAESRLIEAFVWLAPYDLGVSQTLRLALAPTGGDIYGAELELRLESGDLKSWQKTNRYFLGELRRHFLRWRTVSEQEKAGLRKMHNANHSVIIHY
jgi:hypothetical protein